MKFNTKHVENCLSEKLSQDSSNMKTVFVEIDHLNHLDQVTPFMDLKVKRGKNGNAQPITKY